MYEASQVGGRLPDYLATFGDGSLFVDARHPEWNAELHRHRETQERLVQLIEEEIPRVWSFLVSHLPRIGLAEKVAPFRAAIRRAFAALPDPVPGLHVPVAISESGLAFKLELRSPRAAEWRAWLAGPATAAFP